MKLIEFKKKDSLCEAVAGTPRWCLCNEDKDGNFVQVHTPAVCKDYVHEIVICSYKPESARDLFPTHGMMYDPEENLLILDKLRISYQGGTERQHNNLDSNIKLLETFHDLTDAVSPLKVERVDKKTVLIEADSYWISNPILTSIFLVALRATVKKKNISSVEELVSLENIREINALPFGIDGFLDVVDSLMNGWLKDGVDTEDKYSVHNFGAVTLITAIKKKAGIKIPATIRFPYNAIEKKLDEIMKELSFVFVYGTLKEGFGNHTVLGENYKPIKKVNARLPYKMVSLGGFPGLIKDGNTREIVGEIYLISPNVEERLDRLEGYPRFYGKDTVKIDGMDVKVYTLPYEKYKDHKEVENGKW